MQQDKDIRDFMKLKRQMTGKTLNSFAVDADIDPAILSRIENKKQGVKFEVLNKFVIALNISLTEFFTEYENNF